VKRRPYYIYIPTLKGRSGGIRVLLKLCRMLRDIGYAASIAVPSARMKTIGFEGMDLPLLDADSVFDDLRAGLQPIAVYPEVVRDNPLNAPTVARYVLNWPGVLGGDSTFSSDELVWGYSQTLCDSIAGSWLLHIPVVDFSVYYDREPLARPGSCFYAAKFRRLGGKPFGLPPDCTEILPVGAGGQSPAEIAELFARCEALYVFEDTALSLEAALCGCPTLFVPNEIFPTEFGGQEYGIKPARIDDADAFFKAAANMRVVRARLPELIAAARFAVKDFVAMTQSAQPAPRTPRLIVARPDDASLSIKECLHFVAGGLRYGLSAQARMARIAELTRLRFTLGKRTGSSDRSRTTLRVKYAVD